MSGLAQQLKNSGYKLHDYQKDGLDFLINRDIDPFTPGAILADEPGVGKTIQIISLILNSCNGKQLIVLPPSLVNQWIEIINKVLPHLNLYQWLGKNRLNNKDELDKLDDYQIIITTYGLTHKKGQKYETLLNEIMFDRIILDEGHMCSNKGSKRWKGVNSLKSRSKWILTGTPIQNSEKDLMNLLELVGVSIDEYINRTELVIEKYLLRRKKSDVIPMLSPEHHIPDLIINTVPVEFSSEEERCFYRKIKGDVSLELERLRMFNFNMNSAFECIIRLKQASIHPQMVINAYRKKNNILNLPNWKGRTSKLEVMKSMIKKHPNESSLIFCNFKYEMNEIKKQLLNIGLEVSMINGSTNNEQRKVILKNSNVISRYSRGLMLINGLSGLPKLPDDICMNIMKYLPNKVLICQVQSAGTGLNLQGYNRIYFTSLLWNPALEHQCISRAHRLGQKKKVIVTKLVLKDNNDEKTIDERILEIQQNKREIMAKLLKDDELKYDGEQLNPIRIKLTMDDIENLLE